MEWASVGLKLFGFPSDPVRRGDIAYHLTFVNSTVTSIFHSLSGSYSVSKYST